MPALIEILVRKNELVGHKVPILWHILSEYSDWKAIKDDHDYLRGVKINDDFTNPFHGKNIEMEWISNLLLPGYPLSAVELIESVLSVCLSE